MTLGSCDSKPSLGTKYILEPTAKSLIWTRLPFVGNPGSGQPTTAAARAALAATTTAAAFAAPAAPAAPAARVARATTAYKYYVSPIHTIDIDRNHLITCISHNNTSFIIS